MKLQNIFKPLILMAFLALFYCDNLPRDNEFDPKAGNSPGYPDIDFSINGSNNACLAMQPSVFTIDGRDAADDSVTEFRWFFNNDGVWTSWSTAKTISRTYTALGSEEVTLEARNYLGMLKRVKKTVQIVDSQPPVADFSYAPENPSAGNNVTFDASASSDDDSSPAEIQVRWDFENDGTYDTQWSTTKTATHVFNSAGTFTVKLAVKDKYGLGATTTKVIAIQAAPTYTVTYDANGATGGTVPVELLSYEKGVLVTVLDNTGALVKTGATFGGWNTKADGTGTTYVPGQKFTMGASNVTLYAKWGIFYSVTYDGNGSTGGTVPVDSYCYEAGNTAWVVGNTGNLEKTQDGIVLTFQGWNTDPSGYGITYTNGQSFTINSNVILYAKWSSVIGATGPAGGHVFYDKGNYSGGWRYMEAAPVTTEWTNKQWGAYGTFIGGTSTGIGTGKTNTTTIVTWLNNNSEFDRAAQLCDSLVFGGKEDWFLPSKDELNLMYTYLKLNGIGGFVKERYWCSSERDDGDRWRVYWQSFFDGEQGCTVYYKDSGLRVRAVRVF